MEENNARDKNNAYPDNGPPFIIRLIGRFTSLRVLRLAMALLLQLGNALACDRVLITPRCRMIGLVLEFEDDVKIFVFGVI